MQPGDLAHLRTPSAPTLTPDGRLLAVAVGRIDLDADEYRAELWLMPTDGSAPPRRFTSGRRDVRPRFSPTAAGWPSCAPATTTSRSCT